MRRSLLPEEAVQSLHSEAEAREAVERSGDEKVMHCLIKAYFKNICKLASNGSYVPVNLLNDEGSNEGNIDVEVHEDSVLHMIRRVWERWLFSWTRHTTGCCSRTFRWWMGFAFAMSFL